MYIIDYAVFGKKIHRFECKENRKYKYFNLWPSLLVELQKQFATYSPVVACVVDCWKILLSVTCHSHLYNTICYLSAQIPAPLQASVRTSHTRNTVNDKRFLKLALQTHSLVSLLCNQYILLRTSCKKEKSTEQQL